MKAFYYVQGTRYLGKLNSANSGKATLIKPQVHYTAENQIQGADDVQRSVIPEMSSEQDITTFHS
jgi:hypothetical protein